MKISVRTGFFFLLLLIISCESEVNRPSEEHVPEEVDLSNSFYYRINLKDRSDDTFKVTLFLEGLTDANKIYQFPATVPGVYTIFDVGRFVRKFKAYDEHNKELPVTNINTNQWELGNPASTRKITFEVKETFDTPVGIHPIYPMGGTSIENDHVLLNAFDVLGYPTGLKEHDVYLKLDYPASWKVSTSLTATGSGLYYAEDYNTFVDSPIMLGDVTLASLIVDDARITVSVYSEDDEISAGQLLNDMETVINDASAFLKGTKVDRYNFMYLFFNQLSAGALEHSYSSVYVLFETPYTENFRSSIRDIAAHEFFHTVTPLHIQSGIIKDFNFAVPTPSQHLWLYEGVTEWASLMMQYRNGSKTLPKLLTQFKSKKDFADNPFMNLSLTEMSITSYTTGNPQFSNVYRKGALVAAMLDIRLLELSNGERGLRELILELVDLFGPENAFPEEGFFNILVENTYPEIDEFITQYIQGTAALPLEEYFDKIGIDFNPETNTFTEITSKTPSQQYLFDKWRVNL